MSRNRRKTEPRPKKPRPLAQSAAGNAVRVKPGTPNPKYPEIPLGGWSGTVAAVDQKSSPTRYLVEWNERTLDQFPPGYRMRCARDGINAGDMWLHETDLERDAGELVDIEQPTQIVTDSLVPGVAEDGISAVFGLTRDDPLPAVNAETLRQYHRYLAAHLAFPFVAEFTEAIGNPAKMTRYHVQVVALLGPDEADEEGGLMCQVVKGDEEADVPLAYMRVKDSRPNREFVADYSHWFFEESLESAGASDDEWLSPEMRGPHSSPPTFLGRLVFFSFIGMAFGLILGAMVGAAETAGPAAIVGAVLLAFLGGMAGYRVGIPREVESGILLGRAVRCFSIALVGGLAGALAGATVALLIAAYAGALVGGLLTAMVAGFLWRAETALMRILLSTVIGAMAGAMLQTVWRDYEPALTGGLYGAGIGAVGALLLVATIDACTWWLARRHRAGN